MQNAVALSFTTKSSQPGSSVTGLATRCTTGPPNKVIAASKQSKATTHEIVVVALRLSIMDSPSLDQTRSPLYTALNSPTEPIATVSEKRLPTSPRPLMQLFELSMPWWEFVIRALAVYVALLVMVRMSGKRSVGQFTPFDMILLILLGTAVQNSLIGKDISLLGGLILAATLIALNHVVGWITARSRRVHGLIEGRAIQIIEDGVLDKDKLRKEGVSEMDLDEALRRNGLEHVSEVRRGWLETDGHITLIKKN